MGGESSPMGDSNVSGEKNLDAGNNGDKTHAVPGGTPEEKGPRLSQKTVIVLIVAVAIMLVLLLAAGIFVFSDSNDQSPEPTPTPVVGAGIAESTPVVPTPPVEATPTVVYTPTPGPAPTETSLPAPTDTVVPTPSQTSEPLPLPTETVAPTPVQAPALSEPESGVGAPGGSISFFWDWDGVLGPEEYFEVRIWPETTPEEQQAIGWVKVGQFDFDMAGQRGGNYFWTVVVIQGANPVQKEWTLQPSWPYPIWEGELIRELSPAAEPRYFIYAP